MTGRVLVVDDEQGIRTALNIILQVEGYEVAAATNGREALEKIETDRPDVVLLDLRMPVMDGYQCYERVRSVAPDLPVVFMTAGWKAPTEAERHHAAGCLPKPFDVDCVLETVARFVHQH